MKPFIDEIGRLIDFPKKDLIEKDIKLHNILLALSNDKFFSDNFLFKGGTCLIKSYMGYFRFSEDIDFTWKDQEIFNGMSQQRIRKYLSRLIDKTGKIFEDMVKVQGFEFIIDKGNERYVELGGSNKMATFKLWYDSEILVHPMFIKVQFNFVELLKYPECKTELQSLLEGRHSKDLKKFFSYEYENYSTSIPFRIYDHREIMCEKVRAILTRKGTKARDFLDIYLITKKFDENISEYRSQIIEKTRFSLDMYKKYRSNFKEKIELIRSKEIFEWGKEKELLLKEIDEIEFNRFIDRFSDFLNKIIENL